MQNKRLAIKQEQASRILGCGVRFFIAAALTASQVASGFAPFALGSVAAAGAGAEGLSALLGTGLGCLLFLDFSEGLAHLGTAVLIYTASCALGGLRLMKRPLSVPVLSAAMFFLVQAIYLMESPDPLGGLLPCLAATLLTGVSARLYRPLLGQENLQPNCLLFLAMTLLIALVDVEPAGISVGRVLMECLVLWAACQRGVTAGAATGLCGGLLADLYGGAVFFSAAYGTAGLVAGLGEYRGRGMTVLRYGGAVLFLLLPLADPLADALLRETLVALPLFLLLPRRLFGGKRLQRSAVATEAAENPEAYSLKSRLNRCAAAFRELYDSMGRGNEHYAEENPAIIFDRAAERVCRGCALCSLCWRKEYSTTFNALNDATAFLLERGRILPKDLPEHFSARCIHLGEFLGAINEELSAFLLRRRYRRQLEETRTHARRQYAQLSDLLSATAAGLEESMPAFSPAAPSCEIGAALRPKKGESVCGDSVCSFQTDSGMWCLLLSDGMGAGEEARRESALTLRLLRQFLEAGIHAEAALKTLNSALALRGAESQSFSTIDLLTLQPETGEAVLYKYGAAPSYLKKGGRVRRITGGTLPVGLRSESLGPDITRFRMEPGSYAVMVSDGIADALNDEWLQNVLAGWNGTDPQALATLLLAEAARRTGPADDCGVQVLLLTEGAQSLKKM